MLKRDRDLTDAMYSQGVFQDPKRRSYIANWLHPGTNHRCEYRFGIDVLIQRESVRERANGFCQLCEHAHYIGEEGEMHHRKSGLGRQRCSCLENLQWVCGSSHRRRHVHVQWTRKRKVNA